MVSLHLPSPFDAAEEVKLAAHLNHFLSHFHEPFASASQAPRPIFDF